MASFIDLNAQERKVYFLNGKRFPCSSSVTFVKGGEFIFDRGCEESSYLCFGKWYLNGKNIRLEPLDNRIYNLQLDIKYVTAKDSICKLVVFDRNGIDITNKLRFELKDSLTKIVKEETSNSYQAKERYSKISLSTLENIFHREIIIENRQQTDIIIHLNIPEHYIVTEFSKWEIPKVLNYKIESGCIRENNFIDLGSLFCPI